MKTLLFHFDGTNGSTDFPNETEVVATLASYGSAAVTTTSPKFGTGCLDLDTATMPYVQSSAHGDIAPGTGDWTIDFWLKNMSSSRAQVIFALGDNSASNHDLAIQIRDTGTAIVFESVRTSDEAISDISAGKTTWSVTDEVWLHIAYCRDGDTLKAYVNGVLVGSSNIYAEIIRYDSSFPLNFGFSSSTSTVKPEMFIDEFSLRLGEFIDFAATGIPTSPYTYGVDADASGALQEILGSATVKVVSRATAIGSLRQLSGSSKISEVVVGKLKQLAGFSTAICTKIGSAAGVLRPAIGISVATTSTVANCFCRAGQLKGLATGRVTRFVHSYGLLKWARGLSSGYSGYTSPPNGKLQQLKGFATTEKETTFSTLSFSRGAVS